MAAEEAKRPGCAELTNAYVQGVAEALGRDWAVLVVEDGEQSQVVAWGKTPAGRAEAARVAESVAVATSAMEAVEG